jgi:hypothetical protein
MRRRCCLAALLLFAATPLAAAQPPGTIYGAIVDAQTRARIADAVVTATSLGARGARTAVSDTQGGYRIDDLPFGSWTLRVEAVGYEPLVHDGVPVQSGKKVRVMIDLLADGLAKPTPSPGSDR